MSSLPYSKTDLDEIADSYAASRGVSVEEMPGGASSRRFFRIQPKDAQSAVAMFFPDAMHSEEALAPGTSNPRWPFLEVRELLENAGVRVPALLAEHCDRGWILVEDLGDETLAVAVNAKPNLKVALYQLAVRDLAHAQLRLTPLSPGSIVQKRRFDTDLLNWELLHFLEWGVDARGFSLSADQRSEFVQLADHLATQIAGLDYCFVHRDYQSRNLMLLQDGQLAWVDFQDALLGPRVYDLVALLNDSYQIISHDFVLARLREFCAHRQIGEQLPEVCREFDMVTVQRKLKDAGRFVFIEHKKGDATYLKFVEPTIAKARMALRRLVDSAEMRALESWLCTAVGGP